MKQYLLFLAGFFLTNIVLAQGDGSRTIDMQDTVVFNLALASEGPGYVEFPVSFLSDDTINALDFSLKYNTGRFALDSILNQTTGLQITYHESIDTMTTHDTTVYFTSYSLQTIPGNTPLVIVRFANLSGGQFCSTDINSAVGLLNGDACSEKIVACVPNGITDSDYNKNITGIYPNPVAETATIEFTLAAKGKVSISVHDIAGKTVYETRPQEYGAGTHKVNLNLADLENGVYVVSINSGDAITSERISIIR